MLLFNMYKLSSAVVNWNGCIPLSYQIFLAFDRVEQYLLSFFLSMLCLSEFLSLDLD